ncbi:hypothetical protein Pelo_11546 [Pelomyxa schiedti]|nr:hypothetical protein Pelo_11546 [Pelomyxa schiedti]
MKQATLTECLPRDLINQLDPLAKCRRNTETARRATTTPRHPSILLCVCAFAASYLFSLLELMAQVLAICLLVFVMFFYFIPLLFYFILTHGSGEWGMPEFRQCQLNVRLSATALLDPETYARSVICPDAANYHADVDAGYVVPLPSVTRNPPRSP